MPQLIKGGDIERAYLGVSSTVDPDEDGAVVAAITQSGPAADSDLRAGDRSSPSTAATINDPADLATAVLDHKPGDRVELKVVRDGEQRTIEVQLGTRPDQLTQG